MRIHTSWFVATSVAPIVTLSILFISACAYNGAVDQGTPVADLRILREAPVPAATPRDEEVRFGGGFSALAITVAPSLMDYRDLENTENYADIERNTIKLVAEEPVSTFSIDVDTASYANVRRYLNDGQLPPSDAVRVEEMLNYFSYDYAASDNPERPFGVNWEVARTPWNDKTLLLRIGLKGYELAQTGGRPGANIVFLLDVSGSMASKDKLPLMVSAMKLLTGQLSEQDVVSIVVYAGASGVVLDSVTGDQAGAIRAALSQLHAGGSTAGGRGLELAYALARKNHIEGGLNRIFLATDGDFNVGVTDIDALKDMVSRNRKGGISLTTLGFGTGNLNDALMEQIADAGDGNYSYIDSLSEARKVLVEELSGTLVTIAKDVKIQIEFNPRIVAEYRLIGYENRLLDRVDFNNDKVDAGEIGAGHTVTALYEIALVGSGGERVELLRYSHRDVWTKRQESDEFAYLKLRFKLPDGEKSDLIEVPLMASAVFEPGQNLSPDMQFAMAVAAFGQLLAGGTNLQEFSYRDVAELAAAAVENSGNAYRAEFVQLVRLAGDLENNVRIGQR